MSSGPTRHRGLNRKVDTNRLAASTQAVNGTSRLKRLGNALGLKRHYMTVSFPKAVERERAANRGFFALLAALSDVGLDNIVADPSVVHEAFAGALEELRKNEILA